MKTIEVVAAIIEDGDKLLATCRGYGTYKGWWEFPGGKIEVGETPEVALIREIQEELNVEINVGEFLIQVEYDYPDFHLTMKCYVCDIKSGIIELKEHEDGKWVGLEELESLKWLPADIPVIEAYKKYKENKL